MGLEPMTIRLKAECSIQLSYSPIPIFPLTMKSYTPLANVLPRLFLALAIQIVGTIESRFVDSLYLHIDFEFVFSIDPVSLLPTSTFLLLPLVSPSVFAHPWQSLSFVFVLSNVFQRFVVVFYLFESSSSSSSVSFLLPWK